MEKSSFTALSLSTLKRWITLREDGVVNENWLNIDSILLTEDEQKQLQYLKMRLRNSRMLLMNEATVWARGIYPLLSLAEQDQIQAWSSVALQATYATFELDGVADGVLGRCASGVIESPYLIVVEAKRGLEAVNPLYQLYGQVLAAAHLNWENDQKDPQEIFGCYTVSDIWTFIRSEVSGITTDKPTLQVEFSREYSEPLEAEIIVKILKAIVAKKFSRGNFFH
ncbi:conserved hypothetical protein [Gammaproteobacteria bacterium]